MFENICEIFMVFYLFLKFKTFNSATFNYKFLFIHWLNPFVFLNLKYFDDVTAKTDSESEEPWNSKFEKNQNQGQCNSERITWFSRLTLRSGLRVDSSAVSSVFKSKSVAVTTFLPFFSFFFFFLLKKSSTLSVIARSKKSRVQKIQKVTGPKWP